MSWHWRAVSRALGQLVGSLGGGTCSAEGVADPRECMAWWWSKVSNWGLA